MGEESEERGKSCLYFPLRWAKAPIILKREALKAFQCASTVKAVLKNTGMLAGAALADILEAFRRFFTPLRDRGRHMGLPLPARGKHIRRIGRGAPACAPPATAHHTESTNISDVHYNYDTLEEKYICLD